MKYTYVGQSTARLGTARVEPGDVVEASAWPGKNFIPVEEPKPTPKPTPIKKKEATDG